MYAWMNGWMNDDGWHSLNQNQNNVLDGLKPGSFILKLLGHQWASSPNQNGPNKIVRPLWFEQSMGLKPKPKWA